MEGDTDPPASPTPVAAGQPGGAGTAGVGGSGVGGAAPGPGAAVPPPLATLGIAPDRDLWVFGYGSLMWDPGFAHAECRPALLTGYHRRFCIYSHRYRGTPERPGLVLGLDHGGACRGVAYRAAAADLDAVVAYLWQREMVTYAYRPVMVPVSLLDGDGAPQGRVVAWTFTVDHAHPQYCAERDPDRLVRLILAGHGAKGSNRDYLAATVAHLDTLGIRDEPLNALHDRVEAAAD